MSTETLYSHEIRENEQSELIFQGLNPLNHLDCSPSSITLYKEASTACDLFANTCFAICSSIHFIIAGSTVTCNDSLVRAIGCKLVLSKDINMDVKQLHHVTSDVTGDSKYETENNYLSEAYANRQPSDQRIYFCGCRERQISDRADKDSSTLDSGKVRPVRSRMQSPRNKTHSRREDHGAIIPQTEGVCCG